MIQTITIEQIKNCLGLQTKTEECNKIINSGLHIINTQIKSVKKSIQSIDTKKQYKTKYKEEIQTREGLLKVKAEKDSEFEKFKLIKQADLDSQLIKAKDLYQNYFDGKNSVDEDIQKAAAGHPNPNKAFLTANGQKYTWPDGTKTDCTWRFSPNPYFDTRCTDQAKVIENLRSEINSFEGNIQKLTETHEKKEFDQFFDEQQKLFDLEDLKKSLGDALVDISLNNHPDDEHRLDVGFNDCTGTVNKNVVYEQG